MPALASVEPELLQRIHAGDRELFSSLIQQHSRSVFFVALRFAKGDEALARDLVQKTFMKAWSARQSFRGEASFKSWLLRICSNLSINELQRAWRRQEFVPGEGLSEDFERLASPGESSFDKLAEREARSYLREAIDLLSPRQRQVALLRIYEDLSFHEVGEACGISANNAKVTYHHAVRNIRKFLSEKGLAA